MAGVRTGLGPMRPAPADTARFAALGYMGEAALGGQSSLILGGARSGKSSYAEKCAEATRRRLVYIATATAGDAEMKARIAAHQARRGPEWSTIEETSNLVRAIESADGADAAILVDCLTLWLTNLMLAENLSDRELAHRFGELSALLPRLSGRLFLVSNELGLGLVPADPLSRRFRDQAGYMNQTMAKACGNVVFCAAGLPLAFKGALPL